MENINLFALRRKERHESLDSETYEKLMKFFDEDHQLEVIKRTRTKPKEGDIFIVSPKKGVYFYGKVMVADIKRVVPDSFVEGQYVIFIFKCRTKEKNMNKFVPNYDDLLIPPTIVSQHYWRSGYFYTIDNIPLTEDEKKIDFGFYKLNFKGNFFCKETGEVLEEEPKLLGFHGISTLTGVASAIGRELIIDPSLLIV